MRLLFLVLSCVVFLPAFGQIEFIHGTLQDALAQAKKENKPLFVDVHAEWCGPCKYMAKTAFVDSTVSKIYNENFLSVKIDGEKNDGPEVMNSYKLTAFPTLLYFNKEGILVEKIVGGQSAEQLKRNARNVLHPETNPLLKASAQYHKSKKQRKDMLTYILALNEEENDSLYFYTKEYYSKYKDLKLEDNGEFIVFLNEETNYTSELSKQFFIKIDTFSKEYQQQKLGMYIQEAIAIGKKNQDFASIEVAVRYIFPYLERLNIEGLPKLDEFIEYLKGDFEQN